MTYERVEVDMGDGVADARLFVPSGSGPFPLVLFFMDAGGLRPAMSEMAGRLVEAGYAVLQPNLYRRSGEVAPFDMKAVWGDAQERARLRTIMEAFTPAQAMADTRALLDRVSGDARIAAERVGCTGYCMGGRMAFYAASELPDRVVASASIHAGGLVTPAENSPHHGIPKIRARLYFGVAGEDQSCPPEALGTLATDLAKAGVRFQIEHDPAVRHGWAVPDFPVYHPEAAERHWRRLLELFGETLRQEPGA